ncbi:MAG: acetyl-CoA carboxylase carboxyltransferase subunit alpha [Alphaproteobacteria bacterium]
MKTLDFEKTIGEVEERIESLRHLTESNDADIDSELERLQTKLKKHMELAYLHLTPWQKTQVARHEDRPHTVDYIRLLIQDFVELKGDRCFGEDQAIIGGIGRFNGQTVMILGQEKGNDTPTRVQHNFGMAKPEGYRKAVRLMKMAEHFKLPILTFVDTAGAFPGIEGEERGQAIAIAEAMNESFNLTVPMIATVIGEGGSGGAIALASANVVLMLEHSIYSVISPEGCAAILYKDAAKAEQAATNLHLTAQDLLNLGIIDEIIPEPLGGAQRHQKEVISAVGECIQKHLDNLEKLSPEECRASRQNKFLKMTI